MGVGQSWCYRWIWCGASKREEGSEQKKESPIHLPADFDTHQWGSLSPTPWLILPPTNSNKQLWQSHRLRILVVSHFCCVANSCHNGSSILVVRYDFVWNRWRSNAGSRDLWLVTFVGVTSVDGGEWQVRGWVTHQYIVGVDIPLGGITSWLVTWSMVGEVTSRVWGVKPKALSLRLFQRQRSKQ